MNTQQYEERLKSLSPKEIIMSMVNGLRNPKTKINMRTFGEELNGVCYGCAATNALIEATGCDLDFAIIDSWQWVGNRLIQEFEVSVDGLRRGSTDIFNEIWDFCEIVNPLNLVLPVLTDDYTPEQLDVYEQLANSQPQLANSQN